MHLITRQKKIILAFSFLAVLTVIVVIYQGHMKEKYLESRRVPILKWSPEQRLTDYQQEISDLPPDKKSAGEKCFREGADLLRRGRVLLDKNLFQEAQKALQCADDISSTYSTIFNLAICSFYLEDFHRATDLFLETTKIRSNAYGAESFLGLCMVNTGHWKEGMNRLKAALQKARDRKDQAWEAVILSNIGVVYKHLGNYREAEGYHDKSFILCKKIGYRRGEAGELVNLAHLIASKGEIDRAIRVFNNAIAAYREIDDGRGEASTLSYIARLYQEHKDVANAEKFYNQSLTVSRRIGYHLGSAGTLMELGIIAYWQKKPDQALSHYQQAEESYSLAMIPEGTSALLGNLGLLYKDKKEYRLALEYYQKALALDRNIRYVLGEANDLSQIGSLYERIDQNKKAFDAYQQARDLFETLKLKDRVKEMDEHIRALSNPV